ncbi:general substrate transporter [Cystobasidium minutum MCA 4210]|uniref:general substrate transporter n=1 Tax=Cystobasidium minutum MCA 4210 TaxID=1397322 RepID=UPI0034CFA252|eukprot:jgi/Rhomi1/177357/fgenesh1_pg.1_\
MPPHSASLISQCIWICALSFQYGYNISALNSLSSALSCVGTQSTSWLPACFSMDATSFGLVTSIYTIGGLLGSLFTGTIADKRGRRAACLVGALSIALGGALMALAPNFTVLLLGRLIVGLGCGVATVIVPTYLSEIAPPEHKGRIGVLNQVGIVSGIFTGQCASIALSKQSTWRFVPVITAGIAALQILLGGKMKESPVWLANKAGSLEDTHEDSSSGFQADSDAGVHDRLLADAVAATDTESGSSRSVSKPPPQTIWGVLTSPLTRKGLRIVIITQVAQQASGINAVIYYSTDIMKNALPTSAAYIALTITAVNFVMTFPPLYFIDRIGRRPLLLLSVGCMSLFSLILAFSINSSPIIASIAVISFVASFSLGLGPIPFLLIPEVVPSQSAAATGSLGLTLNWLTNFCVSAVFWPLAVRVGQQNIFIGFAIIAAAATMLIGYVYR